MAPGLAAAPVVNCSIDVCPSWLQRQQNQGWDSPKTPMRRSTQGDTDKLSKDGEDGSVREAHSGLESGVLAAG